MMVPILPYVNINFSSTGSTVVKYAYENRTDTTGFHLYTNKCLRNKENATCGSKMAVFSRDTIKTPIFIIK